MPGTLRLYTDASVKGDFVLYDERGKPLRNRVGPAMGAWIGWHDCSPTERPTVAGQAFLGDQGTQRAEYLAAIHGLAAALTYARLSRVPDQLVLLLDNQTVVNTLLRRWQARALAPHRDAVYGIHAELVALGVTVKVGKVEESNAQHKHAHSMSTAAWNQVLREPVWRPQDRPSRSSTSTA